MGGLPPHDEPGPWFQQNHQTERQVAYSERGNDGSVADYAWWEDESNVTSANGWFKRATTSSTASNPNPESKRRKLVIISVLIEHPTEGLIFPLNDVFARVDYSEDHELEAQIKKTGHDIKDINAVIMGHLHLDQAGGLEHFISTKVPIYVHELGLKHAYYSVATKTDFGVYLPHCLSFDLNWQAFSGDFLELAQGINLRHAPGHTPGLCVMQVNLRESGTWVFTTDMYHVQGKWEDSVPQGWLARDHDDWVRSHQMIRMLQKRTGAKMVLGHCAKTFFSYEIAPHAYT
ncbi:Metallo-hydrolase/oxidoreductase [Tothia fuscella]|uniref:Metallo-hydrolase/oxidoreductase n=1 Tax=Tothia fuscella TaxID=1048955 RepID=A0A9P4P318_9PEZI|nr:Metallo-hydrolase/oxidoreductase [Tothia fuscella]